MASNGNDSFKAGLLKLRNSDPEGAIQDFEMVSGIYILLRLTTHTV